MSVYLARLKNIDANNFTNTPYTEPTEPTKGTCDGFVGTPTGHIVKNISDIKDISNWWLLHFADRESEQVALWPPSNCAEVMALNPNAKAAMPFYSPLMQTLATDTPQALLGLMRAGGYSLSADGNDLLVGEAQWIDAELADLITLHKADLIKLLQSEI